MILNGREVFVLIKFNWANMFRMHLLTASLDKRAFYEADRFFRSSFFFRDLSHNFVLFLIFFKYD